MYSYRLFPTFVLMVLLAVPAAAQSTGRNELSVFGGVSLADVSVENREGLGFLHRSRPDPAALSLLPFFRTQSSLDGSAEFGARYGRRLTAALSVEGDFSVAPGHELTERIEYGCPDGYACLANRLEGPAGTLLYIPDFQTTERMVAYHYGGGVRLSHGWGSLTPSVSAGLGGVTLSGDDRQESRLAFRVGGALSAAVGSLNTSVELVDVIVPDHFVSGRVEHDVHLRLGLGVRW